ncbi:MAG: hypothetical protein HC896_02420 [Bacteroidales bacterium]|nr:hypothetical protein [Bacteroidales bacterium]
MSKPHYLRPTTVFVIACMPNNQDGQQYHWQPEHNGSNNGANPATASEPGNALYRKWKSSTGTGQTVRYAFYQ